MGTIADKLQKLLGTKADIRAAITAKGQSVADSLPFSRYPDKIRAIQTGTDTSDATAEAGHILSRKTAYSKGQKITGTIPSQAAQTITPGTTNKTIAAGRYLSGTQTIKGDAGLRAENIRSGVTVFGVAGSYRVVETSPTDMTLRIEFYGGVSWDVDVVCPDGLTEHIRSSGSSWVLTVREYGTYQISGFDGIDTEVSESVTFAKGGAISRTVALYGNGA